VNSGYMDIVDLYHCISHRLSFLILRQYLDKDGCSRNGSREFLFKIQICSSTNTFEHGVSVGFINLDWRGVPYHISYQNWLEEDLPEDVLRWKSCSFFFRENASRGRELVEEEREGLNNILSTMYSSFDLCHNWDVGVPHREWMGVHISNGRVVGCSSINPINSSSLSQFDQLPHLKMIYLEFNYNVRV